MNARLLLHSFLLTVLLGSTLLAQTKKQLEWMKKHPNSRATKQWANNNPDHPLVIRWRARRAASSAGKALAATTSGDVADSALSVSEEPQKQPIGPVRIWKDASGDHQVEAALIEFDETNVTLKKIDKGTSVTLPLAKLSKTDQEHLKTWSQLSTDTQINMLAKDIERRCRKKIAVAERDLSTCVARKERLSAMATRNAKIRNEKEQIMEELEQRRDMTTLAKAREDYTAALQRWESGQPTEADLKTGFSIVYGRLRAFEHETARSLRDWQDELKWARRRAAHLIRADDSPYIEVDGGLYTDDELAAAEKEAADRAVLRKERGTARAAADWYVKRLLETNTIQKAVFLAEGPVALDPRWRVPGNLLDPTRFREASYQVDYVSNAGVRMQKQGRVVVQRQPEGHWDPKEGFDFVVFPIWSPSDAALERAFGSPASSLPIRRK